MNKINYYDCRNLSPEEQAKIINRQSGNVFRKSPRLIDADELIRKIQEGHKFGSLTITELISECPTADVVEVVRCKDCKWHGYLTCSNPEGIKGWVTDNDFCSYGERREDGEIH